MMLNLLLLLICFQDAQAESLSEDNVLAQLEAAKERLLTDRPAAQEALRSIITFAEEQVATDPSKVLYLALGRANYHMGNDEAAEEALQGAVKMDPTWAEPNFYLGIMDFYKNRLDEAEAHLAQATTLDSNEPRYWYELARIQSRSKKVEQCLTSLQQALALNPAYSEALTMAANLLLERGEGDGAIELYLNAVKRAPKDTKILYNLGHTYQKLGQHEAALATLEAVIMNAPDDWYALSKVIQECQTLNLLERRDEVREQLQKLWQADTVSSLSAVDRYCCEIWDVDERRIYAFEHFELTGSHAVRYSFRVIDLASNRKVGEYFLGSFDTVNELMKEAGRLEPGQRAFHLHQEDDDGGIQAYQILSEEPSYDSVRGSVQKILAGELKPAAATAESGSN